MVVVKTQIVLAFLFLSSVSHGEKGRSYSLGISAESFDYREDIQSAARSHENGLVPLLNANLVWPLAEGLTLEPALRAIFAAGTRFDGTDINGAKQIEAWDTHDFFHAEILLVKEFSAISLYAGFSVDWWNRYLRYGTGYRELYQWWVIPVGGRCPLGETGWVMDAALLPMISGSMKLVLSETIQDGEDTLLVLGNRTGFRLKFSRRFSETSRWTIAPWYEQESFGRSETVDNATQGSIAEPDSFTRRWGVTLSTDLPF